MEQPVAPSAPAQPVAPVTETPSAPEAPVTVSATRAAADKGDFRAFDDAHLASKTGKPLAAVAVETKPETPAQPVAPAVPELSNRQKKINEAAQLAAERATADVRAENERLKAELAKHQTPKPAAPAEPESKRLASLPDAPKIADFETIEEHAAAMALFVHSKLAERQTQQENFTAHRARFEEATKTYGERLKAAAAADPELVNTIPPALLADDAIPLSGLQPGEPARFVNIVAEVGLHSEQPAKLYQHLHAHPEEALRLSQLPMRDLWGALHRLDGRLAAASTTTSPAAPIAQVAAPAAPSPVSAAPPPPPEIARTGSSTDTQAAALARGDFRTWDRLESQKVQQRRGIA